MIGAQLKPPISTHVCRTHLAAGLSPGADQSAPMHTLKRASDSLELLTALIGLHLDVIIVWPSGKGRLARGAGAAAAGALHWVGDEDSAEVITGSSRRRL